ncbi:MAG TPA: type VI secretion system tip protein TssI/VgrG, partial [Paracoccaceae bacterium]|nr:type VI secretion system tip protein TssI/VgrG [Paracoccaceae bacterium]
MPERLTQSDRFARLATTLGADVLVLVKLEAAEAISENFEWRISCLLNDGEDPVDPQALIGQSLHVEVDTDSGTTRYFPGLCTDVRFRGWRGDYMYYDLVLRPWTWLLTRETRSRIFHDLTLKEIMEEVFKDNDLTAVEFRLQKSYDPIPYCVQYHETSYDFISRLMEKYGLFFFFEYSAGKHEMIVVDTQTALPDIPEYKALRFQTDTHIGIREDRLLGWQTDNRLRTGVFEVDDYNYDRPSSKLDVARNAKDKPKHSRNTLRKYRYPAGHQESGGGQQLADVLIDAERADAERKFAYGHAPLVHAGGVFTMTEHPVTDENARHFAVRARHSVFVQHFRSVAGAPDTGFGGTRDVEIEPDTDQYHGEYEVADVAKAYRTLPLTPWPRIYGAQTATVIKEKNAPADEEIDVDTQGRILVQFHWKDTAKGAQPSCRVRVAQIWAGPQWGGVWIPRVGMEAVVEFLEGDPDRPLVTGTVYNGKNKPPIAFPADKTKSTIKSNSSKGGAGFNEFRFEDKKDDEEIYIHAERDRLMEIEHDDDITIGNNQTEKIGGSRTFELTGGDETVT